MTLLPPASSAAGRILSARHVPSRSSHCGPFPRPARSRDPAVANGQPSTCVSIRHTNLLHSVLTHDAPSPCIVSRRQNPSARHVYSKLFHRCPFHRLDQRLERGVSARTRCTGDSLREADCQRAGAPAALPHRRRGPSIIAPTKNRSPHIIYDSHEFFTHFIYHTYVHHFVPIGKRWANHGNVSNLRA